MFYTLALVSWQGGIAVLHCNRCNKIIDRDKEWEDHCHYCLQCTAILEHVDLTLEDNPITRQIKTLRAWIKEHPEHEPGYLTNLRSLSDLIKNYPHLDPERKK